MKVRERAALAASAAAGALVWALSRPLTGQAEPWDAESAYYYVALFVTGFACGLAVPARKRFHYLGAVLGQALYMFIFLPLGGLVVLGVIFLFVYTLLFLAGAAIALRIWRKGSGHA